MVDECQGRLFSLGTWSLVVCSIGGPNAYMNSTNQIQWAIFKGGEVGEMAQKLRALAALTEDRGSGPSTNSSFDSSPRAPDSLFWPLQAYKHLHIHIN